MPARTRRPSIVRRDENGGPPDVHPIEDPIDSRGRFRIQVAGRLVGEKKKGLVHEGARDRDALHLAPRKIARPITQPSEEADLEEHFVHTSSNRPVRRAGHSQGERDVLEHAPVRDQPEILVDEADVPAELRNLRPAETVRAKSADLDHPGRGELVVVDETKEGRLSGAARTDEEGVLPPLDLETNILDGNEVAVRLGDICERNHGTPPLCGRYPGGAGSVKE